jgi:3-keto-disaccharide hydrolase
VVRTGFEVQIDEQARGNPLGLDEHRTGAIYGIPVVPGPMQQFYSRGLDLARNKWHDCEIEVRDNFYSVRINELQTTTFLNTDGWRGQPPTAETASGYIGIQPYLGQVQFRNIRVQRFEPAGIQRSRCEDHEMFWGKGLGFRRFDCVTRRSPRSGLHSQLTA